MPFPSLLVLTGEILLVVMLVLWLFSLLLKDASIIDIVWGIVFVLVTWLAYAWTPQGYLPRKLLLGTLVTIWGLRLAIHIGIRNFRKAEDFRYARWREENGARWWWVSFFQVFLVQGFLLWIISTAILAAMTSGFPAILTPVDWLGALIWLFGFLFEAISDAQLLIFKSKSSNKDKLFAGGLWKFSRHPNYFGEALIWWGFYVIALAAGRWWTILSPILMTFLLLKVSGVPMLERTLKSRPGYKAYMQKTSAFFPWFPKET